jgi:hypothetical protein
MVIIQFTRPEARVRSIGGGGHMIGMRRRAVTSAVVVAWAMAAAGCAAVVAVEPGDDSDDGDGAMGSGGAGGVSREPTGTTASGGAGGEIESAREGWHEAGSIICQDHDTVVAGDGRVLVVGACVLDGADIGAALFDSVTETWVAVPGRPPIMGASATRVADGRVLVVGGTLLDGSVDSTVSVLELGATQLSFFASLTVPRVDHAAVATPDGHLLVIGGGWDPATTDIVEVALGVVYAGPPPLSPRDLPMALWWEDAVVLLGGTGVRGGTLSSVERAQVHPGVFCEVCIGEWTFMVDVPPVGEVTPVAGAGSFLLLTDMGGYRLEDGGWLALAKRDELLLSPTGLRLDDGRVLVAGMALWSGHLGMALYDELSDAWHPAPPPNGLHNNTAITLTQLLDGRVLLVGNGAEIWSP